MIHFESLIRHPKFSVNLQNSSRLQATVQCFDDTIVSREGERRVGVRLRRARGLMGRDGSLFLRRPFP